MTLVLQRRNPGLEDFAPSDTADVPLGPHVDVSFLGCSERSSNFLFSEITYQGSWNPPYREGVGSSAVEVVMDAFGN